MKICKYCGETNSNDSIMCRTCNQSCKDSISSEEARNISLNNLNKREKVKKYIEYGMMGSTILIMVILFVFRYTNNTLTIEDVIRTPLLALAGVIMIKYTGEVFLLINIFRLKDLDKSLMSDMYDTYLKIIGGSLIVASILILI